MTHITLLFAHAGSFCAEVWNPTISRLKNSPLLAAATNVDYRHFMFRYHGYRRDETEPATLHLSNPARPRVSHPAMYYPQWGAEEVFRQLDAIRAEDDRNGLKRRSVIGIGHSLGGCALWTAEVQRPGSFDGLILFEPMSHTETEADKKRTDFLVSLALARRCKWDSWNDAQEYFHSYKNFGKWNREVLEEYINHALVKDTTNPNDSTITLACHPHQEASFYSAWHLDFSQEELQRPKCKIFLNHGGKSQLAQKGDISDPLAKHFPSIYKSCTPIPNTSHLMVMEDPDAVSNYIADELQQLELFSSRKSAL